MGAGDRSAFTSASSAAFAGLDCESELILGVSSLRDCLLPALLRAWLLARWWKPPRRLYSLAAEASQKVSPPNAGSANRPPARARRPAGYEVVPTDDALALVAYLLSQHSEAILFETPPPPTNKVVAAASTNAPAPTAATTTNS